MINFNYNIFVVEVDSPMSQSITNWLATDCQCQWFEIKSNSGVRLRFHSPAKFENPLKMKYKPSLVDSNYARIIGIEDDDEAARFKLSFQDDS